MSRAGGEGGTRGTPRSGGCRSPEPGRDQHRGQRLALPCPRAAPGPGWAGPGRRGGAALSRLALTNPCKACDVPGLDRTVFHRVLRPASWAR